MVQVLCTCHGGACLYRKPVPVLLRAWPSLCEQKGDVCNIYSVVLHNRTEDDFIEGIGKTQEKALPEPWEPGTTASSEVHFTGVYHQEKELSLEFYPSHINNF